MHAVAARRRFDGGYIDTGNDRRRHGLGVGRKVRGERACRHEGSRVADVHEAWQHAHRRGGQQVQRIPALRMPPLCDAAALEHDVRDAPRCQAAAHHESGLSCADDDDVGPRHGSLSFGWKEGTGRRRRRRPARSQTVAALLTPTETGTPLVRTSNTAERAFDCITICSSSSGCASPSMSKVTRDRLEAVTHLLREAKDAAQIDVAFDFRLRPC